MLTDKQIVAARKALKDVESEKLYRKLMLHIYRTDQATAAALRLPFRLIHNREWPADEIPPNEYYPNAGPVMIDRDTGAWIPVPADEKLETDDRKDYYFNRLLSLADIDSYTDSDFTGEWLSKAEAERIRAEYRQRIRDYMAHPERYNTRPWYAGDIEGRQYPRPDMTGGKEE